MSKLKMILLMGFVCLYSIKLQAQYIIEQIEYEIPINYELLPEDMEFDDIADEARFFLQLSESKLRDAAQKEYGDIEIIKSTIYIDGDNFAVESSSQEDGKTTVILNHNKGLIYYVLWSQKKIYEMSAEDMAEIQKGVGDAMQKMMADLPPEMKDQPQTAKQITATGRGMVKYGQRCSEYLLEDEQEMMVIWASDDNMGLAKKAKSMSEKLAEIFPSMDEDEQDEWDLVAGKIPVEVRTFRLDAMDDAQMGIQAITRIMKTTPPAEKFILPAEAVGFERGSFKDMMTQMQKMMQGMEEE
ncbi:hypothetical protein BZG01_07840 [Labilibaculum manganireducens]|uniref:DUF4412 domain-containing protein n=1 Tax=Labilibaculum manganireducens TaxID=1940525 RepID=A0A2N3IAA7_9BACT|nr:hypothetical protein [Labilibaculum manganireducens]PKQ67294.1 hypothetical protein BZG01_07840 [Labilibaculum manganireducens]